MVVPDTRGHFAFVASSDSIDSMATLTIRQLDEKTKTRLRVRAGHHGRSMEEEAREILRSALRASPALTENLAAAIRKRFAEFGGAGADAATRSDSGSTEIWRMIILDTNVLSELMRPMPAGPSL